MISGVCNFNGKHGSLKRTIEGEYSNRSRTVTFIKVNCPKRNNEEFRLKKYGLHHKNDSPLLQLPIDMVEDFPVGDSLHLIDLGLMKRFLLGWRDGNFGSYVTKWCSRDFETVSQFLLNCNLPKEIHRTMRAVKILPYWKGTEFRTFLHYLSFIILKDVLCGEAYNHFLTFFCAITICSNKEYFHLLRVAEQLILFFLEHFRDIYGQEYMTSNIHNLSHIIEEVKKFGKLQDFNTYKFENKLYLIKNLIRQGNKPLAQIAKRLNEQNIIELEMLGDIQKAKNNIPFVKTCRSKEGLPVLYLEDFLISPQWQNRWFLSTKNYVVEVKSIICSDDNNIRITGFCLKNLLEVFQTPMKSSLLNIYKCHQNAVKLEAGFSANVIKCKLVVTNYNSELYFVPLLHTL